MTIKSEAPTVFYSIKVMMDKGMDFQEAIEEIEGIIGKIPDHIKDRIRQELG